jgi:hypothetical protein
VIEESLFVVTLFRWLLKFWRPTSAIARPADILGQLSIGLLRVGFHGWRLGRKLGGFASRRKIVSFRSTDILCSGGE